MKNTLKNISYTLSSNVLSLFIATIVTFFAPKILDVSTYSYFQLYVFYINYIGFFHFGWADGIILRYGGEYYENLDKRKFSGQFWVYSLFETILGSLICLLAYHGGFFNQKSIVLTMTGVAVILQLPRTFLQYILQCTNRIKEYAFITIIEKVIYVLLVASLLLGGIKGFFPIILADLLGKLMSLIYAAYQCRDIIKTKPVNICDILIEMKNNISVGCKLMFANIASMMIIGVVRLSIENQWSIETFGKVSLTMSISNFLMIFIRAVALVMFPILRRVSENKLVEIYEMIRNCLTIPLLGILTFYYPVKEFLSVWIPQYADSLRYMALLFPMCLYESKNSMLIETYLKSLRKERVLLLLNILSVLISFIGVGVAVYILHDLDVTLALVVGVLALRSIIGEVYLARFINVSIKKDIISETILTVIFIISSWFIGGIKGVLIYLFIYSVYVFAKRKDIRQLLKMLRKEYQES